MTTVCETTHFGFGHLPLVRELPAHLGGERLVEELVAPEPLHPAGVQGVVAGQRAVQPRRAAAQAHDRQADHEHLVARARAGLAAASQALAQLGHGELARQVAGLTSRLEMAERQRCAPRRAPRELVDA